MTDLAYSGPCFCEVPSVVDAARIEVSSSGDTLVVNQSTTIRWKSDRNATYLQLDLYMYTGICNLKPMSSSRTSFTTSRRCTFSAVLDEIRFNDTGEGQWTPGAGYALESRNDYVFSGLLFYWDTKQGYVYGSEQFAIVNTEGEQPMRLPDLDEIESSLIGSNSATSTSSIPSPTTTTGVTRLDLPTISHLLASPTGVSSPTPTSTNKAATISGAMANWKSSFVLGGLMLSMF